jgi:hypothetical protein
MCMNTIESTISRSTHEESSSPSGIPRAKKMARVVGVEAPGCSSGAQSRDALAFVVPLPPHSPSPAAALMRYDHHTSHAINCTAHIPHLLLVLMLVNGRLYSVCRQYSGRWGTRGLLSSARSASARYDVRVKGMVGVGGRTGERGEMGEASVRVKVGRTGSSLLQLQLLVLCESGALASVAGGEGEAGMVRRKVGHGLLRALRNSSCVAIRSPEAENRREKTTPESRSTKDNSSSSAVGAAAVAAVVVVVCWDGQGSIEYCSPRARGGRELREGSKIN